MIGSSTPLSVIFGAKPVYYNIAQPKILPNYSEWKTGTLLERFYKNTLLGWCRREGKESTHTPLMSSRVGGWVGGREVDLYSRG